MLLVKGAYYIDSLPTQLAVIMTDGSLKITDLAPFRHIQESELRDAPALDNPTCRAHMLRREIMDCVYRFYGLEK